MISKKKKKEKKANVDLREGLRPSNPKTSGPLLTFVLEDFLITSAYCPLCRLLFLSLSTVPGYDRSTPEEAAWMGLSRHKQARTRSCCVWRCRRPFRHPLTHALHHVRVLFSESSIRHSSFESGAQTLANENDHGWIFQKHLQIYVCPLMWFYGLSSLGLREVLVRAEPEYSHPPVYPLSLWNG